MAQFGAFLRHRQQDEGGRDRHQEGFEAEHAEPGAREHACRPRLLMQQRVDRRAQQKHRAVREEQRDRGPTRDQRLVAAAPELVGREPRVGRDDQRGELAAHLRDRPRSPAIARRAATAPAPAISDPGSAVATVEDARAIPRHAERREQDHVRRGRSKRDRAPSRKARRASPRLRASGAPLAHHATAVTRVFCTHTSSNSRPRIASTSIVRRKSVFTSNDMKPALLERAVASPDPRTFAYADRLYKG